MTTLQLITGAALAGALAVSLPARAQEPSVTQSREAALAEFAADVAELQSTFPDQQRFMQLDASEQSSVWEAVIERARRLKDRWRESSFVEVEGFSLSLGIWEAGLQVNFRFKDGSEAEPPPAR